MVDIKKILNGEAKGGRPGEGLIFFLLITILIHQCNDKNISQQFYCCLRYIFYT